MRYLKSSFPKIRSAPQTGWQVMRVYTVTLASSLQVQFTKTLHLSQMYATLRPIWMSSLATPGSRLDTFDYAYLSNDYTFKYFVNGELVDTSFYAALTNIYHDEGYYPSQILFGA